MYVRTFIQHTMCIVQSYVTEEVSNSVTHVRICESVVIKKAVTLMNVLSTQLHVCMHLYTYVQGSYHFPVLYQCEDPSSTCYRPC